MLETLVVGAISTNCYILGCDATKEAVVIDPGGDPERILARLDALGLKCVWILNTHGHCDHVGGNAGVQKGTGAKLAFHPADRFLVERACSMSQEFGFFIEPSPDPDLDLEEKQIITFGKEKILVLHTPGHSPGGVSFVWGKKVLCGDTLFCGSIGRHDLPGASYKEIIESIRRKIIPLGDETEVYPGHGPATTVRDEVRTNPFLTDL